MLAIAGENQLGSDLHIITGPETDIFCDLHGAAIMDVTPLLNKFDFNKPVFLVLTRCKIEGLTHQMLVGSNLVCLSSFDKLPLTNGSIMPVPDIKADKKVSKASKKADKCTYCNQVKELLPIPGFKICMQCAQIELGLKTILNSKIKTTSNTKKKKDVKRPK